MRVLVACEYSGTVRDAFTKAGHYAMSCDILPTESEGPHYQGDVLDVLNDGWDLMIAHPPCTYLSNAGSRWLHPKEGFNYPRFEKGLEAKEFFMKLWNAPIDKICIENPIPSKVYGLPKSTQKVQPYQFGHPWSKGTLLWLKNLPELQHTEVIKEYDYWCSNWYGWKDGKRILGHATTAKKRSLFWTGIADAMADQWGKV